MQNFRTAVLGLIEPRRNTVEATTNCINRSSRGRTMETTIDEGFGQRRNTRETVLRRQPARRNPHRQTLPA